MTVVPAATLQRPRPSGPSPLEDPATRSWMLAGLAGLAVIAVAPLLWDGALAWAQRIGTLLSLVFLVAAANLAVGMRSRAFGVAIVVVVLVYAASAVFASFPLGVHDFFVVAALAGFAIFALAGFNMVFVLEELVFDIHRHLTLRHRVWNAVPTTVMAGLAVGLPWWQLHGGPALPALWSGAVAGFLLLGGWWFLAAFNDLPTRRVLPELHLFAIGVVGATGIAESVALLDEGRALLGSIIVYLALVGTWVYVSYTTLQRTRFLLGRQDALPWMALLMAASYAIIVHVQTTYGAGQTGLERVLHLRIGYLLLGVWLGLASYVLRSLWRLLRIARHAPVLGPWGRMTAGRAARVAEEMVGVERRVAQAVGAALRRMDGALPRRQGWEFDANGLRRIDEEE